jgi:hypothetical protein
MGAAKCVSPRSLERALACVLFFLVSSARGPPEANQSRQFRLRPQPESNRVCVLWQVDAAQLVRSTAPPFPSAYRRRPPLGRLFFPVQPSLQPQPSSRRHGARRTHADARHGEQSIRSSLWLVNRHTYWYGLHLGTAARSLLFCRALLLLLFVFPADPVFTMSGDRPRQGVRLQYTHPTRTRAGADCVDCGARLTCSLVCFFASSLGLSSAGNSRLVKLCDDSEHAAAAAQQLSLRPSSDDCLPRDAGCDGARHHARRNHRAHRCASSCSWCCIRPCTATARPRTHGPDERGASGGPVVLGGDGAVARQVFQKARRALPRCGRRRGG